MLKVIVRIFALIVVLLGIAIIREGVRGLQEKASHVPQTISCAALAESGPGTNGNVTITGAHPLINQVVVFGGERKKAWTDAYIPLVPAGTATGSASTFPFLLHSTDINSSGGLRAFNKKADPIEGVIEHHASEVDENVKSVLQKSFPALDLSKCYVIEHNMTILSKPVAGGLCVLGVGLIIGAGFVLSKTRPKTTKPR